MAAASGVSLEIDSAALGEDAASALTGGEDHALLATFPHGTPLPEGFRPSARRAARGTTRCSSTDIRTPDAADGIRIATGTPRTG